MVALRGHIESIHGSAKWLLENGHHAASTYFSILCMEEVSKHLVMSGCKLGGRGVTRDDLGAVGTHEKKIARFLEFAMPPARRAGEAPGGGLPDPASVVRALARVKELAVYFEFRGGVAITLEGLLGSGATVRAAGLLESVAAQGALAALRPQADPGAAGPDPQEGARAGVAEAIAIVGGLKWGAPGVSGASIPHDQLDAALSGLYDHLAVLCRIAHGLLAGGHVAASVLVGVIALEEGCRHYLLAKCRREGRDAEAGDLRGMASHKTRLVAFFKDAAKALEKANAASSEGERMALDPKSLVRLNAVKELAIYFAYVAEEEVTLKGIFGDSARGMAVYVDWIAQGLVSMMLICDGDASNPRGRNEQNHVLYERRRQFEEFVVDPDSMELCAGWHKTAGMLKELNDAARNLDVKGCKSRLAEIRKYVRAG